MIVGPINPSPSEFAIGGASTRAISSQNSDCSISVAPRPPYSFCHDTRAHRASTHFFPLLQACVSPLTPLLGNVRFKPRSQLVAEFRLFRCEIQIHSAILSKRAAATRAPKNRELFRNLLRVRNRSLRTNRFAPLPIFLAQLFL